jgi:hypothetical protein
MSEKIKGGFTCDFIQKNKEPGLYPGSEHFTEEDKFGKD